MVLLALTARATRPPCCHRPAAGRQCGAVLITGLVILGVLTVIGLNAVRGTVLGERLAGNLRDRAAAFQAAEAAAQAAVTAIVQQPNPPRATTFGSGSLFEGCKTVDADNAAACTLLEGVLEDWRGTSSPTEGVTLSTLGGSALADRSEAKQPRVIIESRYVGLGEQENFEVAVKQLGVHLFTITALGPAESGETDVIIQTTIPRGWW